MSRGLQVMDPPRRIPKVLSERVRPGIQITPLRFTRRVGPLYQARRTASR